MDSSKIINVIDSINLEHDGRPKTASHFSASCSSIADGLDAIHAGVAELVDALDLGSSDESCGGSSPSARTIQLRAKALGRIKCCVSAKQDAEHRRKAIWAARRTH